MLRGFYNAAQGMIVKQRELDAISNNVSNINTAGYKKDEIVTNTFMEELILVSGRTKTSGTFVQTYVDTSKTNLEQSNFEYTESRFDMAIYGNVYFNVMTPGGNVYQTRNGQFRAKTATFTSEQTTLLLTLTAISQATTEQPTVCCLHIFRRTPTLQKSATTFSHTMETRSFPQAKPTILFRALSKSPTLTETRK